MSCFGTDDISWSARSGLVGKVGFPRSASPNPWPTNLLQRSDCCSSGKEESGKDACVMWTNANMELWSWNALNIYSSTGLRKSIGKALLCTWAADAAAAAGSVQQQQQQQQCSRPGGERAVAGSCSLPTPPASALTAWEDFQVLWPSFEVLLLTVLSVEESNQEPGSWSSIIGWQSLSYMMPLVVIDQTSLRERSRSLSENCSAGWKLDILHVPGGQLDQLECSNRNIVSHKELFHLLNG